MPAQKKLLEIIDVKKTFTVGQQNIEVLHGITVEVDLGDFAVILGPSGCGKSTLLHILLGLEIPTSGTVHFLDMDLYAGTTEDDRSDFRKKHVGMVYQQSNWIKSLTVLENVAFPRILLGNDKLDSMQKGYDILKTIGMERWSEYAPTELSSGQQQRISLARALINNPEVIVADEPTGNLDYESGQMIMQLLTDLNQKEGKTVLMVTHDLEYVTYAKTAIRILDGKILGVYSGTDKDKLFSEITNFKRGGVHAQEAVAEVKE